MNYRNKYGEWAFIAGGSEGQGGEYANRMAKEGMNVIVTGRRMNTIEEKCRQLESDYGVQAKGLQLDLGDNDVLEKVKEATAGLEVGVLVYNAGLASMDLFTNRDIEYELYRLNVNVRSLLALSLWFSKGMAARNKGAIVIVSSGSGIVGSPYVQTYSATKAYGFTLAEALWAELKPLGIDVLSIIAGQTIGQNFKDVAPGTPGFQTAAQLVEQGLAKLGVEPVVLCGNTYDQFKDFFDIEARKQMIVASKEIMEAILASYGAGKETENATKN